MNAAGVLAAAAARGEAAAARAVERAGAVLAERAAAAFPEMTVTLQPDALVLQAPGLVARAFGSRSVPADARLAGLTHLAAGGGA